MSERDYKELTHRLIHEIEETAVRGSRLSERQLLAVFSVAKEHLENQISILHDKISEQLEAEVRK